MKALLSTKVGPPESLEYADLPDPVAGEGEVVIAVKAAGVNFPSSSRINTNSNLSVRSHPAVKSPA